MLTNDSIVLYEKCSKKEIWIEKNEKLYGFAICELAGHFIIIGFSIYYIYKSK